MSATGPKLKSKYQITRYLTLLGTVSASLATPFAAHAINEIGNAQFLFKDPKAEDSVYGEYRTCMLTKPLDLQISHEAKSALDSAKAKQPEFKDVLTGSDTVRVLGVYQGNSESGDPVVVTRYQYLIFKGGDGKSCFMVRNLLSEHEEKKDPKQIPDSFLKPDQFGKLVKADCQGKRSIGDGSFSMRNGLFDQLNVSSDLSDEDELKQRPLALWKASAKADAAAGADKTQTYPSAICNAAKAKEGRGGVVVRLTGDQCALIDKVQALTTTYVYDNKGKLISAPTPAPAASPAPSPTPTETAAPVEGDGSTPTHAEGL